MMSRAYYHQQAQRWWRENVPQPWMCSYCGTAVYIIGRKKGEGVIHHKDEDWTNNDPTNLTIMHATCHAQHHALRRPPVTDERREQMRRTRTGRKHTQETRQRMSDAAKRRWARRD